MITDPGKILDPASPDQNHRMFLEVVADAGDIGGYFRSVGKAHPGNLPQGGIRLFGGNGHHTGANPPFLGTGLQRR
jgi:hypothetical protein